MVWCGCFKLLGDYDVSSRFRGGRGGESRDLLVEDPRLEGFEERTVVVKSDMIWKGSELFLGVRSLGWGLRW